MVYVLLADGFEEIEALTPVDILRRGGVEVRTVGITGRTVVGSHGIAVTADITPDEITEDFRMVVFPGGLPGSDHLNASPVTDRLLKAAERTGAHVAAICAAPYLLGRRGLLLDLQATSYPSERFRSQLLGARVSDERVVTDGRFTTAQGMGASAEFSLRLLTILCGEETAKSVGTAALITK